MASEAYFEVVWRILSNVSHGSETHIGATDMITMVEISGGPCVANMLVATPYVSTIVFSDYLPQNIKEVELWQKNDPSAYDWSPYLRYTFAVL